MKKPKSQTQLWRVPAFDDLELLHAQHQTQSFPKHSHERYALGVIEQGALGFYYRGKNVVAPASSISLCIPGEVHTGQPAVAEGWTYRMFYFESRFLEKVASELAGKPRDLPFFQSGVIADAELAQRLHTLHVRLARATPTLEQETHLLDILAVLINRYADDAPPTSRIGREARAITQVKNYLESHYAGDVSLADLSHLTGLSRYHLVRVFREAVGVPPHAYLRQVRVKHAKDLLAKGYTITDAAFATGFTDQSHLTRWFKRFWGFTPGQYRTLFLQQYCHSHSVPQ